MDKTPKYLKMCEGAFKDIGIIDDGLSWVNPEKIQNLWARLGKDGKYYKLTQATIPEAEGWFQVYYQDQLQEMVKKNYTSWGLLTAIHNWTVRVEGVIATKSCSGSMEQFWLSFVMWEEHHKIWNNKKERWC